MLNVGDLKRNLKVKNNNKTVTEDCSSFLNVEISEIKSHVV